jgi:hypothetical protein
MNVAAVRPSASGASLLLLRRPLSFLQQTLSLLPRSARCDVHRPDLLCPLHVDSRSRKRLICANTGHSSRTCRTGQFDPGLPYKVGPVNGRETRESGLQTEGVVCAPKATLREASCESVRSTRSGRSREPERSAVCTQTGGSRGCCGYPKSLSPGWSTLEIRSAPARRSSTQNASHFQFTVNSKTAYNLNETISDATFVRADEAMG